MRLRLSLLSLRDLLEVDRIVLLQFGDESVHIRFDLDVVFDEVSLAGC